MLALVYKNEGYEAKETRFVDKYHKNTSYAKLQIVDNLIAGSVFFVKVEY